jgi:hypothetical protein
MLHIFKTKWRILTENKTPPYLHPSSHANLIICHPIGLSIGFSASTMVFGKIWNI